LAPPARLKFTPFPGCPRSINSINYWNLSDNLISNGLREFWEIATVLRLAAMAISKQYCLTLSGVKGSCIAWASLKTVAPKLSAALIFL
jgi:hypothetical protein